MRQRPRANWLPLLLGLYLLAIVLFIVATRGPVIIAGHPAYPILLAVVALAALVAIVGGLRRRGRA